MNQKLNAIVQAPLFQYTIVAVILLAGILAGLETSSAVMQRHGALFRALDAVILGVFVVEMVLKMGAHGRRPWMYFKDGWNVFDFAIVMACFLPLQSQFSPVLRLARGLRLLRLVTALPKLQLLVGALLKSLGAMGYVGLLLGLTFYIYGVAGVHLFGKGDPEHFGSLSEALLSLMRVVTLDNWSDLFSAASATAPFGAVIYFVSFILLGTMIMLNLFIGIIMNSMSEMHAEIEARDRARHEKELGGTTLDDDFNRLEQQLEALTVQTASLKARHAAVMRNDRLTKG